MTTTMTLDAPAPAWLEAKIDAAAARKVLKGRKSIVESMQSDNERHAAEVRAAERASRMLITNATAHRQGGAYGATVIYSASGDDPRRSPHSAGDITAAEAAIVTAEKVLKKAEAKLAGTESSFDAFNAARAKGSKYVWWPQDAHRDPRLYRVRGQAVSDDELAGMGPHRLRAAINSGSVVEVPS